MRNITNLNINNEIFLVFSLLDPVRFFGEGQYNLHSLKEIIVTDSFFGLKKDARNCQNIETFDDCITRKYIEKMKQECGCIPLSLGSLEDV